MIEIFTIQVLRKADGAQVREDKLAYRPCKAELRIMYESEYPADDYEVRVKEETA